MTVLDKGGPEGVRQPRQGTSEFPPSRKRFSRQKLLVSNAET